MKPTKCPFCHSSVSLVDSAIVHKQSNSLIYLCDAYPVCDARVGCHPGTDRPLGTMANQLLRTWRNRAHARFDPLWHGGGLSRAQAYKWLAEALAIDPELCHIGMFDIEQCKATIQAVQSLTSSKAATF